MPIPLPPVPDSAYIQPAQRYSHAIENIRQNEQDLPKNCLATAISAECRYNIQYALWYLRKKSLRNQLPNAHESAKTVLAILYNGENAEALFLSRLNDINNRANFFAINDLYYQQSSNPVRWFGGADSVSRQCLTGLGAKHCASYLPFGASKIFGNPAIFTWRQVSGETLLANGFSHFKALFNADFKGDLDTAKAWDIAQLKREQALLQPIHEQFLSQHPVFVKANKTIMRLRIQGGVNLLNQADRVRYGCFILGYGKSC